MTKRKTFRYVWFDSFIDNGVQCPYQRALGFALHYHMNDEGYCYPGHRRLAKVSGMTRPSVAKFLRQIEESGWVEIIKDAESTKGGHVDGYQAVNPIDHLKEESGQHHLPLDKEKRSTPLVTNSLEAVNGKSLSGKRQRSKRPTPLARTTRTIKHKQAIFPDWLNIKAWKEFEQHRIDKKIPLSELSAKKNMAILEQHKDQQQEIVDLTIASNWTGLFPPKEKLSAPSSFDNAPSRHMV